MFQPSRRAFLADVGRGTLVAAVGLSTAVNLGLTPAEADQSDDRLRFGQLEGLVELMQSGQGEGLLAQVVEKLRSGTPLQTIVAAAALANARTFGGQDYVGFHTMMALAPCYAMASLLPAERQALPVLKVLHRNSGRIAEHGGVDSEVLHVVEADPAITKTASGAELLAAVRAQDFDRAERVFAAVAQGTTDEATERALEELLVAVQDQSEVHRIVMPYRAYDLLDIVGAEHAHTMLRQSVRYCVQNDRHRDHSAGGRDVLPKLLEEYRLLDPNLPTARPADDKWLAGLADTIFRSKPEDAAAAAAAAVRDGFPLDAIGTSLSLAANQLVLRDKGRSEKESRPEKPAGSVHGDSIGVHASDSANAWRHLAQVGSRRNRVACLILGAYQVARDRIQRGGDFLNWEAYPHAEQLERQVARSPEELLAACERAIRGNDQAAAAAAMHQYGASGHDPAAAFALLLEYAITEDGALHAEKYYQTVREDYADSPAPVRWRHVTALARVTASACGHPAPGVAAAKKLVGA
jgi:hypothetical protein